MKELRGNMRLVGALVVIAFVALSAWFALTVFEQGSIWASSSRNTRLRQTSAQRGDIIDRDGVVLATTQNGERVYLANNSARRALAAVVGDDAGMSGTGVESYYSAQLLDISDSLLERLSALFNGKQRKGSSVELTIDARLTAAIAGQFPSGYRGSVCVLNYKTGEVLAMVSLPSYDPSNPADAEDTAYLNRCLQGLYTPGSVFKLVTLCSALEHDSNVINQSFSCAGTWNYEGGSIVCAGKTAHGTVNLESALSKSCNVAFGKLAYQLGLTRMRETAETLGFNENMKLGDFVIYNSQFPTSQQNASDLVWSGIGQSTVLVTPMHMTMITASIANGGAMIRPWMVKRIASVTGAITHSGGAKSYRQVMSAQTASTIARYMRSAVQSGTARKAAISGYTVCGKTGSAETSDDKSVETNSWFTGFIQDSAHPYAVSVVIEQGGAGSGLATELARKALSASIEYIG
ncbi:MAG: penicillin-binding protein 2 [Clostridia bacterium]|nr:penicillin-binding protein 2 [Clostridia bacterium]